MRMKASTDYALRAVVYLAAKGTTCSSKDIAHDMALPRDYLIQLAQLLRFAGIVEARPGKYGGYRLAKDPSDISLLDVLDALESDAGQDTPAREDARLESADDDECKRACELAAQSINAYLGSVTIASLIEGAGSDQDPQAYLAGLFSRD